MKRAIPFDSNGAKPTEIKSSRIEQKGLLPLCHSYTLSKASKHREKERVKEKESTKEREIKIERE